MDAEGDPVTTRTSLGDRLEAIPGVATAEITLAGDGPPVARIFLDGSEAADVVRERVDALLGSQLPVSSEPVERPRRAGLGKGLADLMSSHESLEVPRHLAGMPDVEPVIQVPEPEVDLDRVAVVETDAGVSVEVEDNRGNRAVEPLGEDGSIDGAVVRAVVAMAGGPDDATIELTDTDTPAGPVIVATIELAELRTVGSAFVEFGRPWAVATSVMAAIRGI